MRNSVIIPSLNPDDKLLEVINGLLNKGFDDIIVVDDGSDKDHKKFFAMAAKLEHVQVLEHEVNRGKGRALKTAFKYFLDNRKDYDGVITVDGDNQHRPDDVYKCCEAMVSDDALILGVRDFSKADIPARSKFGNNLTSSIFKTFCKLNISDTQTGLRAIPKKYVRDMMEITGERYEYETNMLLALKSLNIPFEEVEIETVYIDDNASSHFNPVKDSIKIYKVILSYFFKSTAFKYTLSSITSWVIDNVIFNIIAFSLLNFVATDLRILTATIAARVLSSIYNCMVNYKLVFKAKGNNVKIILKYYCLWLGILCCSFFLVDIIVKACNLGSVLTAITKIIVDLFLFLASYNIQKKWVFKD